MNLYHFETGWNTKNTYQHEHHLLLGDTVSGDFVAPTGQQQVQDEDLEGENGNVMMDIAQRNIIDHVDGSPAKFSVSQNNVGSEVADECEEESFDVKMQSISNDHEVIGESSSDRTGEGNL